MRTILVVLTILFSLSAHHILADELLLGRILSVDQKQGTVALEVLDGPDELMKAERDSVHSPKKDSFRSPESTPVVIEINRNLLPEDIRVNSIVRIWGSFDRNSRQFNPLNAPGANMPGFTNGHHDDMTGVRRRLGRGNKSGGMHNAPGGSSGSSRRGGRGGGGHHGR